jgi:hypothetical protein
MNAIDVGTTMRRKNTTKRLEAIFNDFLVCFLAVLERSFSKARFFRPNNASLF